jgi:hypothetical protein
MRTSLLLLLLFAALIGASSAWGQAYVTRSSPGCSYGEYSMSSGSPIGCFAYCGCADNNTGLEWQLTLLASAGWDCTLGPANGYVSAGPSGSGVSGSAGITTGSILGGTYSPMFGTYLQTCDGFVIDSGMLYTNNC